MTTPFFEEVFRYNVLNTKTPTAILLFYKRIMIKDVTGIILRIWWQIFYCSYIHKYVSNFVFATRHVMDEKCPDPIRLYKCLACGGVEYNFDCVNWWKYFSNFELFPSISSSLRFDYEIYIEENVKRNEEMFNGTYNRRDYRFIKEFTMDNFQKLLGPKPLEWNEPEKILIPYYKTKPQGITFNYALEDRIKRKRVETDELFMNKRQKCLEF